MPAPDSDDFVFTSVLDVTGDVASSIKAYPVPVIDNLTVEASQPISEVRLFASGGQLIRKWDFEGLNTKEVIEMGDVDTGVYIVVVNRSGAILIMKS